MLVSWLFGKEKKKPSFTAFANFREVNTPAMTILNIPEYLTVSEQKLAPAHHHIKETMGSLFPKACLSLALCITFLQSQTLAAESREGSLSETILTPHLTPT